MGNSVRRKWAIALGAAGVVVVLTGCSTILTALSINGASSGSSVTPSAGECWQETHAQLRLWATWSGAKPVACTQPHQAFTFAVMTLTEKFTGSWLTNGGSPHLRDDIAAAAYSLCESTRSTFLPAERETQYLLAPAFYVPSVKAWAGGARWVRCDISALEIGSSYDRPRLASLPTDIRKFTRAVTSAPDTFLLCLDTVDSTGDSGPFAASPTYSDCAAAPQWRLSLTSLLPGDAGVEYPDKVTLDALTHADCGARFDSPSRRSWVSYPSRQTWSTGDRSVVCWTTDGARAGA
ncbi:septum formation family protein [Lacisediminihabitans sp.]|uniref:septum formation family protein n=1 Tax=Lacisediminihabitans sp. TaxID=2787631 RepID=UPI002F95B3C7